MRPLAEQDLLLARVLAKPQMAEVRRLDAHARLRARGAELIEQCGVTMPLLEERRLVFGLRAVAERFLEPLELLHERALRWARRGRAGAGSLERVRDALEEVQLLGDDRRRRDGHGGSGLAGAVGGKEPESNSG